MKKRGQFYLIAAAIIILVIMGLNSTVNRAYVTPRPVAHVSGEEVRLIDSGIYSEYINITLKSREFYEDYSRNSAYPYPEAFIYFTYGNLTSATIGEFDVREGTLHLKGTAEILIPRTDGEENQITISIKNISRTFSLNGDEMFYFIAMSQKEGETLSIGR